MTGTVPTAGAIHRLPQSVADAIAAGEVVERPAAVVKELCENAVDAGARSIDIAFDGAGTVRIRVADDGAGIAAGELVLATERHATSKIAAVADLEAVATLGFRGEALASMAAVADLTVVSRQRSAAVGARLRVRHGEVVEEGPWGGPAGTTVEVLDLFAATPARLRFLRGERAETAAAVAVASDLALIHPGIRVTMATDGRMRVRSAGDGLDGALRCVFGAEAAELLHVAAEGDINVAGAISEPRRHRATRAGLVLVVNGRRVHNHALLAAVGEAYRGLVPARRYPFGLVSVALDPVEVDVNVHPTKREVRFRDERAVFAAVQRACWHALQGAAVYAVSWPAGEPGAWLLEDAGRGTAATDAAGAAPRVEGDGEPRPRPPDVPGPAFDARDGAAPAPGAPSRLSLASLAPLRALGQQAGRWLLATSSAGVVVVDPHAAHEKVLYARLLAEWTSASPAGQLLLLPALVECDARRMELFGAHQQLLAACGFAVEPFGPTTLRCTAVPAATTAADPARLVGDLLDSLGGGGPVTEQRHRAAALVACHAAVRFGDALGAAQQQQLLDSLVATPGGLTCPHGRPALAVLDEAWLRRMFGRPVLPSA